MAVTEDGSHLLPENSGCLLAAYLALFPASPLRGLPYLIWLFQRVSPSPTPYWLFQGFSAPPPALFTTLLCGCSQRLPPSLPGYVAPTCRAADSNGVLFLWTLGLWACLAQDIARTSRVPCEAKLFLSAQQKWGKGLILVVCFRNISPKIRVLWWSVTEPVLVGGRIQAEPQGFRADQHKRSAAGPSFRSVALNGSYGNLDRIRTRIRTDHVQA